MLRGINTAHQYIQILLTIPHTACALYTQWPPHSAAPNPLPPSQPRIQVAGAMGGQQYQPLRNEHIYTAVPICHSNFKRYAYKEHIELIMTASAGHYYSPVGGTHEGPQNYDTSQPVDCFLHSLLCSG